MSGYHPIMLQVARELLARWMLPPTPDNLSTSPPR